MSVNKLFLIAVIAAAGFASCSKVEDDTVAEERITTITLVNAGPDTLNVYQRGTRLNNGSNLVPGGQYTSLQVAAGTNNYQFKKAGSPITLIDVPLTINPSINQSVFVAGQSADKVFLLRDSLPSGDTTANTCRIRFVNASPIDGTLDVKIGTAFDQKNLAFKSATPFILVSSGKVPLAIRKTGDTTQIAKGTLTLTTRYTYTLFTKGITNGTGTNAFGARIVVSQN